jgi:hypothetical protein
MYLAIDQYGNKTILKDKKYSTLKEVFYCGSIRKMFIDNIKTKASRHTGYVLGQGKGNASLWVDLYELKPINT